MDVLNQVVIIVKQISILTILGLIGFFSARLRYLPASTGVVVSQLVIKVTAPFLIFTTLAGYSFSHKVLMDGVVIYISGLVFMILAFFVATFFVKPFALNDKAESIFKMQVMFGNVIFMSFPLLLSIFGEKGIVYAIFYNLANDTLIWTLGIRLVNSHNKLDWKSNLKHLVNANTIAFGLGLLCIGLNLQGVVATNNSVKIVYDYIFSVLKPVGQMTIYLSMIFIGFILSDVKIEREGFFRSKSKFFVIAASKLLLFPLLATIILYLLSGFIDSFAAKIIILQLGMPCGTIATALAAQYGSDYHFAAESVFYSTIISVITLPVLVFILGLVFGVT